MDTTFNTQDYRDSFLAILQGLITHNGLNMASEAHFRTTVSNVHGLAIEAEKALARLRVPVHFSDCQTVPAGSLDTENPFTKDGL
jgi:hypothetical protein